MDRRQWLSLTAGAMAGRSALGQTRSAVKRVGILTIAPPDRAPFLPQLLAEMRRRGWEEGRNVLYVYPEPVVHAKGLDAAAQQLVALKVDLIYSAHEIVASAALHATRTIPIVTWTSSAMELGFAKTLSRPGGNVTGLMTMSYDEHGRVISLLREMRPGLSRIGFSVVREIRESNTWFESFEAVAKPAGLQVVPLPGHYGPASIAPMLEAGGRERVQVLITGPAWWLNQNVEIWERISAWAIENRVITKGSIVQRGQAMLAFGLNLDEGVRLMADQIDRVLRGADPAELPFIQPTRFDLFINQRRARAAGFPAPASLLLQATEVIE
jgi:putative ABC transport system substrate-binding protein